MDAPQDPSVAQPLSTIDSNAGQAFNKVSDGSKNIKKDHKMTSFLARRRKGVGKSGKLTKGGLDLQSFYKTKICPFLLSGHCSKGEKCSYAHSQSELKDLPNLKKTKVCQQFQLGKCQMGSRCSYAHGDVELRFTPEFYKTSLCTAFQKGTCQNGDKCRYAHGDSDLRTSSIFDQSSMMKSFNYNSCIPVGNSYGGYGNESVEMPTVNTIDEKKTQELTQAFNPVDIYNVLGSDL